jgi:hypothetical protein
MAAKWCLVSKAAFSDYTGPENAKTRIRFHSPDRLAETRLDARLIHSSSKYPRAGFTVTATQNHPSAANIPNTPTPYRCSFDAPTPLICPSSSRLAGRTAEISRSTVSWKIT